MGTELRNRVHARGWPVQPGAGQLDVLVERLSVGVMVQLVDAGLRCLLATPPMPDLASSPSVTRPAVAELMTVWLAASTQAGYSVKVTVTVT